MTGKLKNLQDVCIRNSKHTQSQKFSKLQRTIVFERIKCSEIKRTAAHVAQNYDCPMICTILIALPIHLDSDILMIWEDTLRSVPHSIDSCHGTRIVLLKLKEQMLQA